MMQRLGLSIFLYTFLLLAGYSHAENPAATDQILAKIGGSSITVDSFKAEMEKRGHGLPGSFAKPEQREALLTEMVRSEEVYASALQEGYDKRPEVLEAVKLMIINRYRENNLEHELQKITASEDEIKTYYTEHPSDFVTPLMVRAAVIQITVPMTASDEKKAELLKRAEDARGEAMKLDPSMPSLGGVAVKYSDDQVTRYRGGDTGLLRRGEGNYRWDKEVMDTIFSLKNRGDISPIVTTVQGFYLVKLVEMKESVLRPFDEVTDMIRGQVFREKRNRTEKEFYEKLSSGLKVEINSELLKKVQPRHAGTRLDPPAMPR